MSIAFRGDPAVKQAALAALRKHIAAGTLQFHPAWSDGGASPMGSVIKGDDPQVYADRLGYPVPLALMVDRITSAFHPMPQAEAFAEEWLERTPVGADLSRIVPETLIAILEEPELVAIASAAPAVEEARQTVVMLHRRALDGESINRKVWKAARTAALAASDATADNPLTRSAGLVIEAAAWPATMRTVLQDTMGARGGLEVKRVCREIGWTGEKENRVNEIMEAAEGREPNLVGLERVYRILETDDPGLARDFRQRNAHFEQLTVANIRAGRAILERIAAAPVIGPGDQKFSATDT